MFHMTRVLVASGSAVLRKMMRILLNAYSDEVLTAATAREMRERIAANCDIDLVIAETTLPDGDGIELLPYLASLGDPKPQAILVAAKPNEEEAKRVADLGGIGYIGKPIALRDISRVVKRSRGPWNEARGNRRRTTGRAYLLEGGDSDDARELAHLYWQIRDLSSTGAFLETQSPIPVGTDLELNLSVNGAVVRVTARVVRIQAPSWETSPGVGVAFVGIDGPARAFLEEHTRPGEAPGAPTRH